MNTIKIDSGNTKMVAHRGVSGIEKENTNAAFIAAGNRSHFGIETDVHKTLDGKYVCIHDDNTARVAIDDMVIEKTTFDCLRGLLLCDRNGLKGRTDLRIPTLAEYIETCKRYEKAAVLELKNEFSKNDIAEICEIIKDIGYLEHLIFISFCLDNLLLLRELYPEQEAQFLTDFYTKDMPAGLAEQKLDIDIKYTALTEENIAVMHKMGIKINCWTCDDKNEAERLASLGVDFITSNILE